VQSGSDRVLRRMGRGYTVAEYERLVADLRQARPGLALSTDFIVGFPRETEEDFRQTLGLVERVGFSQLFAFKYSPRPGTPALRLLEDAVDDATADRRLQELFDYETPIQRALNEGLVGSTLEVLVTGWGRESGQQLGRTSCHRIVCFNAGARAAAAGELVEVRIDAALDHSLLGSRVGRFGDGPIATATAGRGGLRVLAAE